MFGNYIKSMPKLNDAEERKKKSLKPGPAQVNHKYTRGTSSSGKSSSSTRCQKCEQFGHFTYACPVTHAPYKARPTRTQQLLNPKAMRHVPSVEVPEEFLTKRGIAEKILADNELERQEAQAKPNPSKSAKKKAKPKANSAASSTSSSDSDSTSDSDSDSDSESDSTSSSTTSSSSSGDGSDSSSASDSSHSIASKRRLVPHRAASSLSSTNSSISPRRNHHHSRLASRKRVESQTPPTPRPRYSPHHTHGRTRSRRRSIQSDISSRSRRTLSPQNRSPRRKASRADLRPGIGESSRDRNNHTFPIRASPPSRRYPHRSRSVSREPVRVRARRSPRGRHSPYGSYETRYRSKYSSRDPSRSQTPPSPKRRRHSYRSDKRDRSPWPPLEPRASLSPIGSDVSPRSRGTLSPQNRSPRRQASRTDLRHGTRESSRDRNHHTFPAKASVPTRHHRHPSRSVSRESFRGRARRSSRGRYSPYDSYETRYRSQYSPRDLKRSQSPRSPKRRHPSYRSDKRDRSPWHPIESRASLSPRRGSRFASHSGKDFVRPESYDSKGSPRDYHRKIETNKSPSSPHRHRHRPRSLSRESFRSRTPPSPRRGHSPPRSYKRARSPRRSFESRSPPAWRPHSRSPRRRASRANYEYDSREPARVPR